MMSVAGDVRVGGRIGTGGMAGFIKAEGRTMDLVEGVNRDLL